MGKLFDPTKPTNYISNLDVNTVHGKPMSYPMPQSGFTCLIEEQWSRIDWLARREDQFISYIVQGDVEYPAEHQDSDNDYPIAIERVAVSTSVLSDKQVEVDRH